MTKAPKPKDLYKCITPLYAPDWIVIGMQLGLTSGELKGIEAKYPNDVKLCCNLMLEKWLEMDPTASWAKLITVITVSSGKAVDKGSYLYLYSLVVSYVYT